MYLQQCLGEEKETHAGNHAKYSGINTCDFEGIRNKKHYIFFYIVHHC